MKVLYCLLHEKFEICYNPHAVRMFIARDQLKRIYIAMINDKTEIKVNVIPFKHDKLNHLTRIADVIADNYEITDPIFKYH